MTTPQNNLVDAVVVPRNATQLDNQSNVGFNREPGEQGNAGSTAWYVWYPKPEQHGSSLGFGVTGFDTYIGVYEGPSDPKAATHSGLVLLAQNDDGNVTAEGRVWNSYVSILIDKDKTYYIQAGGFSDRQGTMSILFPERGLAPSERTSGGGGGGGAGTGNLIGAFAVGSTMLGAEPGGGGGGGGGAGGAGNLIGAFGVGSTMVGAEPGGGGGSDVPMAPGSPQPLAATIGGTSTAGGAFQTFVWEVAGRPVGVAAFINNGVYLSSRWHLAASTATDGKTRYQATSDMSGYPDQGVLSRTFRYTVSTTGGSNNFSVSAQYRRLSDHAIVSDTTRVSGGHSGSYSQTLDAGAGNYIAQIRYFHGGQPAVYWDVFGVPSAYVTGLIDSPIGLLGNTPGPVGEATVAGDLTQSVLRSERIEGSAQATGSLDLAQPLRPQVAGGNATVAASLGIVVPLEAAPTGEGAVTANLSQYISPGTSVGSATVEADLTRSVLRGQIAGAAEVTARLNTQATVQGGDAHGSATVTAHARHQMFLSAQADGETVRLLADLGKIAFMPPVAPAGSATVAADVGIHLLDARRDGGAAGSATVVGHVRYEGPLNAHARVEGVATVWGDFRARGKIAGQADGSSSVVGMWNLLWHLGGVPAGESTTAGQFEIYTIPAGPIEGDASVVADWRGEFWLSGTTENRTVEKTLSDGTKVTEDWPGRSGASIKPPTTISVVLAPFERGAVEINGESVNRGRLYVRPQDFDPGIINGHATVIGQALVSDLRLRGLSQGGRIDQRDPATQPLRNPAGNLIGYNLNDTLVSGYIAAKFFFEAQAIGESTAAFDFAILLLNDSGLIWGAARLEAFLDFRGTIPGGKSEGRSFNYGQFDRAKDLSGRARGYAGVGKWFKDGFQQLVHFDYSLTMAPIPDTPEHAGKPGNAERHGGNAPGNVAGVASGVYFSDDYIDGHIWDGTYDEWRWDVDVVGLQLKDFPELWDPDLSTPNNPVARKSYPGAMRRKYQLLQPGKRGAWVVDTRGPGFLDKALRGDSVGEARFDEPHSSVDMDLELKSSMRGRPVGESTVVAAALILSFRKLLLTGNATLVRTIIRTMSGNMAKSPEALVPISRENVDLLAPVNQTTALYV